jgi:hypothetical protein
MAKAKRQQVTALHAGMPITAICRTVDVFERPIFKVKELLRDGNYLKFSRLEVQRRRNGPSPPSDVSPLTYR